MACGLKSRTSALYGRLFPNRIYVNCKPTDVYAVEPLPVGTQKYGVAKLLKEIGWQAKPMQPRGSSSGAVAWLVDLLASIAST